MKNLYKGISFSLLALASGLVGCKNGNISFDDYEGGISVYFPYQSPTRTLVMGNDTYDTKLDNDHKCLISTTMGGSYSGKDITVTIAEDATLLDHIYFKGGDKIELMPSTHYSIPSKVMKFNGDMKGSVEVSFTEAFFNDPKAVTGAYVIPVFIESQTGAERVLTGTYDTEVYATPPQRTKSDAWKTLPKDYTLFRVNYICKYEGYFLRRITSFNGKDSIHVVMLEHESPVAVGDFYYQQGDAAIRSNYIRNANEPIVSTKTINLDKASYDAEVNGTNYSLVLDFSNGTISAPAGAAYTVTGGKCEYKDLSEKNAWGNKDRDGMYLEYTVDGIAVKETLVLQRRGVTNNPFEFEYRQ